MSPRSEEFAARARRRLEVARLQLDAGFPSEAAAAAYYAMLYAARAALSEEDRHSKTHSGTWTAFGELFVKSGRFDPELAAAARRAEQARIGADYEAEDLSAPEGEEIVSAAERFVAAVDTLFD